MHLLVAEDNELNYEVVSELLGMNGISCERAEDGSVCVDMFSTSATGTYDGILMELQMPVMDGITLLTKVRARASGCTEHSYHRHHRQHIC